MFIFRPLIQPKFKPWFRTSAATISELRKTPNKTELREWLGGRLPVPLLKLGSKVQLEWLRSTALLDDEFSDYIIYIIYIATLSILLYCLSLSFIRIPINKPKRHFGFWTQLTSFIWIHSADIRIKHEPPKMGGQEIWSPERFRKNIAPRDIPLSKNGGRIWADAVIFGDSQQQPFSAKERNWRRKCHAPARCHGGSLFCLKPTVVQQTIFRRWYSRYSCCIHLKVIQHIPKSCFN